jgi:hypothetical protein
MSAPADPHELPPPSGHHEPTRGSGAAVAVVVILVVVGLVVLLACGGVLAFGLLRVQSAPVMAPAVQYGSAAPTTVEPTLPPTLEEWPADADLPPDAVPSAEEGPLEVETVDPQAPAAPVE